jgi:DNA-binding winged helix-turn-helix (wHTH) protein
MFDQSAARVDLVVRRFGEFELDLGAFELRRAGTPLAVTHKAILVLSYLLEHRNRLVQRSELLAAVWPGVHVSTGTLSQAVWELRRALSDDACGRNAIKTVRNRGYRLVA